MNVNKNAKAADINAAFAAGDDMVFYRDSQTGAYYGLLPDGAGGTKVEVITAKVFPVAEGQITLVNGALSVDIVINVMAGPIFKIFVTRRQIVGAPGFVVVENIIPPAQAGGNLTFDLSSSSNTDGSVLDYLVINDQTP